LVVEFEDRAYKLGDAVGLDIELRARKDLEVEEGRVDLVIEKRFAEEYERIVASREAGILTRGPKSHILTRREIKEHREEYVHSSVWFTRATSIQAGEQKTYKPTLRINPEPHPKTLTGMLAWFLVATVRTQSGEELKEAREITVQRP